MFKIDETLKCDLHNRTLPLFENLITVFTSKHTGDFDYYTYDVYKTLNSVYINPKTGRLPSKYTILKHTYLLVSRHIAIRIVKFLNKDYNNIDITLLVQAIQDYFYWLADKLSLNSCVSFDEVKSKLHQLIKDYSLN